MVSATSTTRTFDIICRRVSPTHIAPSSVTPAGARESLTARRRRALLSVFANSTTGHLQFARPSGNAREPLAKYTFHTADGRLASDFAPRLGSHHHLPIRLKFVKGNS